MKSLKTIEKEKQIEIWLAVNIMKKTLIEKGSPFFAISLIFSIAFL